MGKSVKYTKLWVLYKPKRKKPGVWVYVGDDYMLLYNEEKRLGRTQPLFLEYYREHSRYLANRKINPDPLSDIDNFDLTMDVRDILLLNVPDMTGILFMGMGALLLIMLGVVYIKEMMFLVEYSVMLKRIEKGIF